MSLVRTFVAIRCSEKLAQSCGQAIVGLQEVVDGVRWVEPENIHLTLKFLGEVEDRELHAVCRRVAEAAKTHMSFSVVCRGVGAFPSIDRPNTIWIGVEDSDELLAALQRDVEEALIDLGFPAERRPYKPHLTLGRTKSRRNQDVAWEDYVNRNATREIGELSVDQVTVFSSELERRGPLHTPLAHCPLSDGKA